MEFNWGNFEEEPIEATTINTAELLDGFSVMPLASGHIEATYQINPKRKVMVIVGPISHTVGFYSGEISFEKEFQNRHILDTRKAIMSFSDYYRYFY